jgi:NTE family protein
MTGSALSAMSARVTTEDNRRVGDRRKATNETAQSARALRSGSGSNPKQQPKAPLKTRPDSQRFSLVLGAGGMVGLAYHAGVLRALNERFGLVPNDADLIVGTSAGAVVAGYLRAGWSLSDLWDLAIGSHASLEALGGDADERRASMALKPNFSSAVELSRRAIGSYYVAVRSFVPLPLPKIPDSLQKYFRAGLFTMKPAAQRFRADLGTHWPDRPLAICSYDIAAGHRAVFSASSSRRATFDEAVLASCAIPGFYTPCRIDGRIFVDGGVHSATNLDLAAREAGDRVITIAPMSFEPGSRLDALASVSRRLPQRQLAGELAEAKRRKVSVLTIRPDANELRAHGSNLMKSSGGEVIAELAYNTTMRRTDLDSYFK